MVLKFRPGSSQPATRVPSQKMQDRKFAITIPCYKSESTIAETLAGIMEQEEAVLQRVVCVVIADDVSPDGTLMWCGAFGNANGRP